MFENQLIKQKIPMFLGEKLVNLVAPNFIFYALFKNLKQGRFFK
jgi:hypothetical protein